MSKNKLAIVFLFIFSFYLGFRVSPVKADEPPAGCVVGAPPCPSNYPHVCLNFCCQRAGQCFELPFPTVTLPPGVTPTASPTPAPPGPPSCGEAGERCCGGIPPYTCKGFNVPSDPNSALCQCLACNCLGFSGTGPCPASHPYLRNGRCCDSPLCNPPAPTASPPPGTITITPWNPEQAFCDLGGGKKGINTALGCINVEDSQGFVTWFFQRFVGIAGGIALVLMIWGSIKVILSGGDPEKVKDGKSLVTSAASGLLFMIFSLLLLRFIGVDILELPGLTK